jgi:hypothetical protein
VAGSNQCMTAHRCNALLAGSHGAHPSVGAAAGQHRHTGHSSVSPSCIQGSTTAAHRQQRAALVLDICCWLLAASTLSYPALAASLCHGTPMYGQRMLPCEFGAPHHVHNAACFTQARTPSGNTLCCLASWACCARKQ